jgi:hypothetical protein
MPVSLVQLVLQRKERILCIRVIFSLATEKMIFLNDHPVEQSMPVSLVQLVLQRKERMLCIRVIFSLATEKMIFLNDHPVEQSMPVSLVQLVLQRKERMLCIRVIFSLATQKRSYKMHLHLKFQIQQLVHISLSIDVREFEAKPAATPLSYLLRFFRTTSNYVLASQCQDAIFSNSHLESKNLALRWQNINKIFSEQNS